jgi:ABC-type lipoprotein release transport system permease subunit
MMENSLFRDIVKICASFVVVMVSLVLMSFIIAIAVQDSVRKNLRGDIERLQADLKVIREHDKLVNEQNSTSKTDRAHLNAGLDGLIKNQDHLNIELENTRDSLKRLEMAVKTGHYP